QIRRIFHAVKDNQQQPLRNRDQRFQVVVGLGRANGHHVLMLRRARNALQRRLGGETQRNALGPAGIDDFLHPRTVLAAGHQHVFHRALPDGFFHGVNAVEGVRLGCLFALGHNSLERRMRSYAVSGIIIEALMDIIRSILLSASQSKWLRERATRYPFVRRTVSRFMPGEELDDAVAAARDFQSHSMATVFTHLGENVTSIDEVDKVTQHYLMVLDRIQALQLPSEISVKLTHLGLDIDSDICYTNLQKLIERACVTSTVWIDMEASPYVDATLKLYRRARAASAHVRVGLKAYLYRTEDDLAELMPLGPTIRLVKGAYKEPASIAFRRKRDVDENFFALTKTLLSEQARRAGLRATIATHDVNLIRRIQ